MEIMKNQAHHFSPRELQVIKLLSEGLNTTQIAKAMEIATGTVRSHRKNIFKKSHCHNTTELVAQFIRNGWI